MNKFVCAIVMSAVASAEDKTITGSVGDKDFKYQSAEVGDVKRGQFQLTENNEVIEKSEYVWEGKKDDKKNAKYYKEEMKKFDKYFYYAIDAKNMEVGSDKAQCKLDTDCGKENEKNKCCVNALMKTKDGKQHQTYRCMTKSLVDLNIDYTVDDMTVSMRCSNAYTMGAAVAVSAATLAAMTLY